MLYLKEKSKCRPVGFGCYACGKAFSCSNVGNDKQDCFSKHAKLEVVLVRGGGQGVLLVAGII